MHTLRSIPNWGRKARRNQLAPCLSVRGRKRARVREHWGTRWGLNHGGWGTTHMTRKLRLSSMDGPTKSVYYTFMSTCDDSFYIILPSLCCDKLHITAAKGLSRHCASARQPMVPLTGRCERLNVFNWPPQSFPDHLLFPCLLHFIIVSSFTSLFILCLFSAIHPSCLPTYAPQSMLEYYHDSSECWPVLLLTLLY